MIFLSAYLLIIVKQKSNINIGDQFQRDINTGQMLTACYVRRMCISDIITNVFGYCS